MTRRDAKSKAEASTTVVPLGCDDGHLGKTEAREVVFLDDLSRIGKKGKGAYRLAKRTSGCLEWVNKSKPSQCSTVKPTPLQAVDRL
jgi:hypothetical protein